MADKFLFPTLKSLISIDDIEKKNNRDKTPEETNTDSNRGNLENAVQEEITERYQPRVLIYSTEEKYEFDLYVPIGIKSERRWFRFPNLNPIGVAYLTLYKIELDQNLRGDLYDFVGVHEIGHIKDVEGHDESKNTINSAYRFQLISGKNYTYLPK